jgi:uncharacterized protein YlxW (UPF0749 family)
MEQFYAYLAVTIGSILVTAGIFLGSTKTTFRSLEKAIEGLLSQITEIRNDQKAMSELTTRVYVNETKIKSLEKCQDHTSTDVDRIHARLNKLKGE